MSDRTYAQVVLLSSAKELDKTFEYAIYEPVFAGCRVLVPFGKNNSHRLGYVVEVTDAATYDDSLIKPITKVLDHTPIISHHMMRLAKWMAEKYFTSLSRCLAMLLPSALKDKPQNVLQKKMTVVSLIASDAQIQDELSAPSKRADVIRFLLEHGESHLPEIKKQLAISDSPIKTLAKKGIVSIDSVVVLRDVQRHNTPPEIRHKLTDKQQEVIAYIRSCQQSNPTKPVLLHGVTGSGKTEVYMQLIEEMCQQQKESIVLVPEISLTPQLVDRFTARFGSLVSFTHSRLSAGERLDQWRKAQSGEIAIMIGPRSALFSPFNNLGMIIIDEEHEHSYQSDQNPKYDAREVAKYLSLCTNAALIMGSATPSLESFYATTEGDMHLATLPDRVTQSMPDVSIVDMREELRAGNRTIFSRLLFERMTEAFSQGEQVILFLNRRGHSTFVSCRHCGGVLSCDDCSVNYTFHKYSNDLVCHYCGKTLAIPDKCPFCGSEHIKYFGVGTQKVEEELKRFFPGVSVLRMDFDTTSHKDSHRRIYEAFVANQAQVLIGTQMIAKGLDFPKVTVVGVIAADLSLYTGDFRSSERTFQLLTQVSGRAGRREKQGMVVVQTYTPTHYSIVHAQTHDYLKFYDQEITARRLMHYPPFSHLFAIRMLSGDEKILIETMFVLKEILNEADADESYEMLGPAPSVVSKIRNDYRWVLYVKGDDEDKLKSFVLSAMGSLTKNKQLPIAVRCQLTLNPMSAQ